MQWGYLWNTECLLCPWSPCKKVVRNGSLQIDHLLLWYATLATIDCTGVNFWVKDSILLVVSSQRFHLAQSLSVAVVKTKWIKRESRLSHQNGIMMPDPVGVTVEGSCVTWPTEASQQQRPTSQDFMRLNHSRLISPTSSRLLVFLWELSLIN